ncbi:hypothetical protein B0H10DRAFT_1993901 [Mycena sp. CBHHK59/15]|nr:hypothetical protein B0H10DRAFT_1993901 [Mycena sp. CBHHK59/15]
MRPSSADEPKSPSSGPAPRPDTAGRTSRIAFVRRARDLARLVGGRSGEWSRHSERDKDTARDCLDAADPTGHRAPSCSAKSGALALRAAWLNALVKCS